MNNLILVAPLLVVAIVCMLAILPPRIEPLTQEEMRESAEYHNRLARKNVYLGSHSGRRLWDGSGEEAL
jgi:hypothetical protein